MFLLRWLLKSTGTVSSEISSISAHGTSFCPIIKVKNLRTLLYSSFVSSIQSPGFAGSAFLILARASLFTRYCCGPGRHHHWLRVMVWSPINCTCFQSLPRTSRLHFAARPIFPQCKFDLPPFSHYHCWMALLQGLLSSGLCLLSGLISYYFLWTTNYLQSTLPNY